MKTDEPERRVETAPLDVIRVETALSRFPIHRLAKSGPVRIAIREADSHSELTVRWEVGYHSEYGAPGPLAYRLDTLIVNRKLDEAGRPVPSLIRLGSLSDICRGLGVPESGKNIRDVKRALRQNAFAGITAKIRYKGRDGSARRIEIDTTRYTVVMTGESLPDGREADAVYLLPHDIFRKILDTATTRPLDYDYLRSLPPVAQRLYELLSFPVFGALKHGGRARMRYSEFCTYAPQTRYVKLWEVRRQMERLHAPHRQSGYLAGVEFEPTTDRDGQPDWTMTYTPGPKAKAEYRAFTAGKGGPVAPQAELPLTEVEPEPEPTGLEAELVARGVSPSEAAKLVREYPEDHIRAQIERLDWLREKRPKKIADPGAYLADAIRRDFALPAGFDAEAKRAERQTAAQAQDDEARRAKAREREDRARVDVYLKNLSPEERERIEADALAQADPGERAAFEAETRSALRRMKLALIRDAYIERLLKRPASDRAGGR